MVADGRDRDTGKVCGIMGFNVWFLEKLTEFLTEWVFSRYQSKAVMCFEEGYKQAGAGGY